MIPESELTEPERRVCQAAASGTLIDLWPGERNPRLQEPGANCAGGNAIRAEFLRDLLTGAHPRSGTVTVQAVKLRGAQISGVLDLEAAKLICPLLLQNCYFENPVDLAEAQAPVVRFPGCHPPRLDAAQLETRRNLELAHSFEASSVNLAGAHIGGALNLNGAEDLLFGRGFTAVGEIDLTSAQIGTVLDLDGATLTNVGGAALTAERILVGQAILCREGFTAHGKINLTGAKIDAELDFTSAALSHLDDSALILAHLKTSSLILRPATAPREVDLRHANIGRLADDEATWPAVLRLQNFTYKTLDEQPALVVRKRLTWLRRDPDGYLPYSYEQLADAYRRSGREEAARQTAIAKQWHRRTVLNPANKLWNWVLYLTVGYGYRTWQAGLWLLALLMVGTRIFDHAYPAHMFATKQLATSINGVAYAADVLIPIINLGEQNAWQPRGAVLYWSWVLAGAGWVLTTAVVAGLTGLFKRN
jgi:hypothetical protein